MSDIITTLKNEDGSNNIYPNIKEENLPEGINGSVLADGSITPNKLNFHLYRHSLKLEVYKASDNYFIGTFYLDFYNTSSDALTLNDFMSTPSNQIEYAFVGSGEWGGSQYVMALTFYTSLNKTYAVLLINDNSSEDIEINTTQTRMSDRITQIF